MYITLSGPAGCGKDTAADAIQAHFPQFDRYALAGPMKTLVDTWLRTNPDYQARGIKEALVAFPVDESYKCLDILIYHQFNELHAAITPEKAREIAQAIYRSIQNEHTLFQNTENDMVLVTSLRKILQKVGTEGFRDTVCDTFWLDIAPKGDVIITDVRFPNEALWFNEYNNTCSIRIERPDQVFISESGHSSEQGLDKDLSHYKLENSVPLSLFGERAILQVRDHMELFNYHNEEDDEF